MVTFKEISTYRAIKEIYKHKNAWRFLYGFVDSSEEVEEDEDGEILFVYYNGKSETNNYYTNEKKYFWIAGFEGNKIVFLQLVGRMSGVHMELTVAQKKYTSKAENCFGGLVEFMARTYVKTKYLTTYPMNDVLKEYYKKSGFEDWKNELKLIFKR